MLFYLDNFQSVSPNAQAIGGGRRAFPNGGVGAGRQGINRGSEARAAQRDPLMESIRQQRIREMQNQQGAAAKPKNQNAQKRGINENYARELMELHTLGVDGGYTQKDVQEVARCFTGWTIFAPRAAAALRGANLPQEMIDRAGSFYFNPRLHDDGEKTVLGHKIPAGGGVKDGLMVLDILAHHPSTAKFISTKLARYFVSDNPSPELVARVAGAFQKSDGDIRKTLRAIFDSPEFNSPLAYRAKIKTPFELAVSAIRALGGDTNGGPVLHQLIQKMGEPLYGYQAPTGYPDNAENWVNTGALLERLNFGIALASNKIPGTRVDISKYAGGVAPNSAAEKTRVMNLFIDVILQGDITDKTRISLTKQFDQPLAVSPPAASNSADATMDMSMRGRRQQQAFLARNNAPVTNPEAVKIAGLILGSPDFQRQ